jgi:predicted nuclease with TOPRIM domain
VNILEEIRRILLPEITGLEKEIKFLSLRNEELLKIISKLQEDIEKIKERLLKLEIEQGGLEEKIVSKLILTLFKQYKQLPDKK